MLLITILLAIVQVFVLDQIHLWGALPIVWVIFLVTFNRSTSWHGLLRWSAVFSLIVSSLHDVNPVVHLVATLFASLGCIGVLMLARDMKFLKKVVWAQALLGVGVFLILNFLIYLLGSLGTASIPGAFRSYGSSVIVNFALVYVALYISKQHRVAR